HPSDIYLDFTREETMRALEASWRPAVLASSEVRAPTERAQTFLLRRLRMHELLLLKGSALVERELLTRRGVPDETRLAAVAGLANRQGVSQSQVLLEAIRGRDADPRDTEESLLYDLGRLLTGRDPRELAPLRPELEDLALKGARPATRRLGFAALIAACANAERAWELGLGSAAALGDLLDAAFLVRDANVRESMFPRIQALLEHAPA